MIDNIAILIDAPTVLIQLVVDGILVGAIFALAAYGMALVWGVMNVINLTQGDFVILGGFVPLYLVGAGVSPFLGIPVAAAILFVIGWATYRLVIFRVVDQDLFTSLLATFGLSILFQQLMNQGFGADVQAVRSGLGTWFALDGMLVVSQTKVVALAIGLALVVFMKRSRLGQAIRATAQNARAARILGVDTDRVYAVTYALNAAICGAAGALVVMIWSIHPYLGIIYTVRAFTIVVVAGLGNIAGVIAAGLGLGAAENFAGFVLGAEYQAAFVYILLVAILVWRSLRLRRQRKVLR